MNRIPIIRPWMDEREAEAARRVILSGWITQGPEVAAFEREFAEAVGAKHACAVANCTAALHLALKVAGVKPRDEVITASHSFIATANAIRYCGALPVFVDIDPSTYNMDARRVEEAMSERTRAVLCVHQMGMPCELEAIVAAARRRGVPVVEDAACAIGSEVLRQGRWERIGRPHGDIACFSFHPRKIVSTGDGGMITTANTEWDRQARLLRQHCMNVPDTVRHGSSQIMFETYSGLGYNYRMTDIQAAVGREQLKRLPEIVARRRELAGRYGALLASCPGLRAPHEPQWARSNWQSYAVRLPAGADQRAVMQFMLNEGIATRRGIMCAHREPAYGGEPWSCGKPDAGCSHEEGVCARLTESERAQEEVILLPLYHQMTEEEQNRVVRALEGALAAAGAD